MTKEQGGQSIPPFLLNTIPKSGTHLLNQILAGIKDMTYLEQDFMYIGTKQQLHEHHQLLKNVSANEFIGGHIYYSPEWAEMFHSLGMKQIFLSRDPRDIVVSYSYYLKKLTKDPLLKYAEEKKLSKKEIQLALIEGVQSRQYIRPSIKEFIETFLKWRDEPNVYSVTFEALIGTQESQRETVEGIASFLQLEQYISEPKEKIIDSMIENIDPSKSGTFRKGKIGNWHDEFDEEVIERFKVIAGDLLISLGYETDLTW